MTPARYELVFHDRTVRVLRDGVPIGVTGTAAGERYDSIAVAADRALEALRSDVDNVSDCATFATEHLLALKPRLVGEARELDAACMHWHVRWGIDLENLWKLDRDDRVASPSIYETLGFGSHTAQVEALRGLLKEWRVLASRVGTHDRERAAKFDAGIADSRSGRPPRVGIVGVTGAGKSAFINAILDREVASVSEGNATGCITDFVWVADPRGEGVAVTLRNRADMEAEIREFRGGTTMGRQKAMLRELAFTDIGGADGLLSTGRHAMRLRQIEGLEACRELDTRPRRPLEELWRFTNAQLSPLAYGVERVTVHVSAKVLERVTLVDTPGIHDPDQRRARLAINEAATLAGWFYLVRAIDAPTDTVRDAWGRFDGAANNRRAALILTMLDLSQSLGFSQLESQRRSEYAREGWDRPIAACSAAPRLRSRDDMWRAFVVAAVGLSERQDKRAAQAAGRRLQDLQNRAEEQAQERLLRSLDDYTREVAGLIRTGLVMAGVAEEVHHAQTRRSQADLARVVDSTIGWLRMRANAIETSLASWEKIGRLETDQRRLEAERTGLEERKQRHEAAVDEVARSHDIDRAAVARGKVHAYVVGVAARMVPSKEEHASSVKANMRHLLYGPLKFNFLEEFEVPLAEAVRMHVDKMLRQLIDDLWKATGRRVEVPTVRAGSRTLISSVCLVTEEKLTEFHTTALARDYASTKEACTTTGALMAKEAAQMLSEDAGKVIRVARTFGEEDALREVVIALEEYEKALSARRGSPMESPARLSTQLADLRALLSDAEVFRKKLPDVAGAAVG